MDNNAWYDLQDSIYLHQHVRVDFVRIAYATFVRSQNYDYNLKAKIDKRMLHSFLTAEQTYVKTEIVDKHPLVGVPIVKLVDHEYPIVVFNGHGAESDLDDELETEYSSELDTEPKKKTKPEPKKKFIVIDDDEPERRPKSKPHPMKTH